MIRRLMRLIFEGARLSMKRTGRTENASLVLLAGRLLNVLLVIIAVLCILTIAGVDTKTALAGLGIGGVAVAFGAQKTVENLLGGIFLLTDQALAVGDSCCISNRMGTVEDITLRSVRLRTPEQSLMSIPAGSLSQASIENFTTRGKIPVQTKLRLRYGLNPEQIQTILTGIRQLLKENQKIESSSSYVRLVDFGVNAIEFDLFAYLLTSRNDEFLSIREELLLQIATVVDSAGASFSTPTQFVYLDRPPGDDQEDRVGPAHLVKKSSQSA
jgi:MscS family membrane protein